MQYSNHQQDLEWSRSLAQLAAIIRSGIKLQNHYLDLDFLKPQALILLLTLVTRGGILFLSLAIGRPEGRCVDLAMLWTGHCLTIVPCPVS
jgi:hypothetical protein